ncbi:GGDEF domain-containing protein [Actinoplanes sp. NEAU-A12]|uniref:GGDEF domain-containing protein n=1 Tax=Actinoplanes sandaracinus TaxID=3045177 RepID=A0ABT6WUD5_9ACTN|nr:GGDEF domain-containing protein [Actinoplanes sandaracinus]MDI6103360.1 GGDEF domain-containing protein [Actinoplanes sandaracinus]
MNVSAIPIADRHIVAGVPLTSPGCVILVRARRRPPRISWTVDRGVPDMGASRAGSTFGRRTSDRAPDVVPAATGGGRSVYPSPKFVLFLFGCMALTIAVLLLTRIPVIRRELPWWVTGGMIIFVYVLATLATALRAVLVREQRLTWSMFAAGLASYTCGIIYSWSLTHGITPLPFPSLGEVFWLTFYPLACGGMIALIHVQLLRSRTQVLLDGASAGLGAAACWSALVIEVFYLSPPTGSLVATVAAFGYPVGDAALLGMALCLLIVGDRATRRELSVLLASLGLFAGFDGAYIAAASRNAFHPGDPLDIAYPIAVTLIAVAAWREHRHATERRSEWVPIGLPIVFALSSLALLIIATRVRISPVPIVFAALTLLVVVIRAVVAFRQIRAMALHDVLTGLPNRALVMDRIEQLLARGRRTGTPGACLHLDLDGFKQVNDTLGHAAGDQLLRLVSGRLNDCLRRTDTVGRMGGDEFVVLLDGLSQDNALDIVAGRLLHALRQPFQLDAAPEPVRISASIGIAVGDRSNADQLLHDADMALYRAKAAGRDCYRLYQSDLDSPARPAEPSSDVLAASPGDG